MYVFEVVNRRTFSIVQFKNEIVRIKLIKYTSVQIFKAIQDLMIPDPIRLSHSHSHSKKKVVNFHNCGGGAHPIFFHFHNFFLHVLIHP